jgi:hypothetical protein
VSRLVQFQRVPSRDAQRAPGEADLDHAARAIADGVWSGEEPSYSAALALAALDALRGRRR